MPSENNQFRFPPQGDLQLYDGATRASTEREGAGSSGSGGASAQAASAASVVAQRARFLEIVGRMVAEWPYRLRSAAPKTRFRAP